MQYGFLMDHRRCIGCHACTVACKAENSVPVGSFRTWVKYVESGRFPAVRRSFAVLRCNQCSAAPCAAICPVNALEKRPDGIVDLDRDACIGCRACMQACPYDALYLNNDTGAVEKCHFCAHRVEKGLEPACAVVCPVEAIIPGDLHDPQSRIARMVDRHETEVRRPDQGTGPNVHYLGHAPVTLRPGAAARPETYLWSDRPPEKSDPWPPALPLQPDTATVYDAGHKIEWGWPVGAYLVTKGIASGAALLAPFLAALGVSGPAADYLPESLALLFILLTTLLLGLDLGRPRLFHRVLTRPHWKSWLVKGAVILLAFTVLEAAGLLLRLAGQHAAAAFLRWPAAALALLVAGYTAFLFGQCQGRNLWQSRLLLPHLLAQAALCGAACYLPLAPGSAGLRFIFIFSAAVHLIFSLLERFRRRASVNAAQAAAFLGSLRLGPGRPFRDGLLVGSVAASGLALFQPAAALAAALGGLFLYEWAYIRTGQLPPLS